ncbi:Hypothetical_protein [Hexamita inflata]|uniref:Hypothetical_protein n=1 Tax=Hexamita inflata TaxID=28002 RepID=A0ABP1M3E6_9EUKA
MRTFTANGLVFTQLAFRYRRAFGLRLASSSLALLFVAFAVFEEPVGKSNRNLERSSQPQGITEVEEFQAIDNKLADKRMFSKLADQEYQKYIIQRLHIIKYMLYNLNNLPLQMP